MNNINDIKKTADFIKEKTQNNNFDVAIILGSNLKEFVKSLNGIDIPYNEIPNFPKSKDPSSNGKIIYSDIADKKVLSFFGKFYYYDGYTMDEITYPVRVMKELGIKILILSSPAACLIKEFSPGDIMIVKDHINLMGNNPLIGENIKEHGKRFVDMSRAYSPRLINILKQSSPVQLKEGILIGVTGPTFETYAEVRFLKAIGGTAVSMSTIPEVIVANHCGIETISLCYISNYASGVSQKRLEQNEVIELAKKIENDLISVILNLIAFV